MLHEHPALIYRQCLVHGTFPLKALECIMIPLIKDSNGMISDSSNYRSIASSSIILKIFDWIIILLFGEKLKTN